MKPRAPLLVVPALVALAACSERVTPVPVIVADAMHMASTGAAADEQPLVQQVVAEASRESSGIEACAAAARASVPGRLQQVGLKSGEAGRIWEFEVRSADGALHDVACTDGDRRIVATERRLPSHHPAPFAASARIDAEKAGEIALQARPGTIESFHHQLRQDGQPLYRFAIRGSDGEYQVKVDAVSGEVVELAAQLLDIGAL